MAKLCGECHFVGKGKTNPEGSLLVGGFCIGFGLSFFVVNLQFFSIIGAILSIAFLYTGYTFIRNLKSEGSNCPVCKNKHMIPLDSDKAQSIIQQNNIDISNIDEAEKPQKYIESKNKELCTQCNKIGKAVTKSRGHIAGAIFLIIIGIASLPYTVEYLELGWIGFIAFLGSLVWIGFGVYALIPYLSKRDTCPSCKAKGAMIPLDTPKAQQIIQQNNLSIPE